MLCTFTVMMTIIVLSDIMPSVVILNVTVIIILAVIRLMGL